MVDLTLLSACPCMLWDEVEERGVQSPDTPPQSWDIAGPCTQTLVFVQAAYFNIGVSWITWSMLVRDAPFDEIPF